MKHAYFVHIEEEPSKAMVKFLKSIGSKSLTPKTWIVPYEHLGRELMKSVLLHAESLPPQVLVAPILLGEGLVHIQGMEEFHALLLSQQ